ncbi:MAG: lysine 2,3-aminomutase, partial [Rhizobium sp.]
MNVMRPIRTVGELERAGLIDADQAIALEAVAERYA